MIRRALDWLGSARHLGSRPAGGKFNNIFGGGALE